MHWNEGRYLLTRVGIAIALLMVCVPGADGASPRYNFIEGGLLWVDPDAADSDTGFFAGGSFELGSFDFFGEFGDPGDFEIWQIGGGWHGLLGERADLVAQAAIYDTDFDDGLRVSAGIRWMILDKLEINGFLNHLDLDLDDSTTVSANVIGDLTPRIGIGGGFEAGDESDTARGFVRFNLGRQN